MKMDAEKFQKYLKERYHGQISWYDKKSLWNQKWYERLQWGLIVFSAMTPVLIAIDWGFPTYPVLRWIPIITSVFVAVLASALTTFKLQENWLNYRTTCETLKKEIHFYEAGIGEYADVEDKEALFVERSENFISREHSLWTTLHKEERKVKV